MEIFSWSHIIAAVAGWAFMLLFNRFAPSTPAPAVPAPAPVPGAAPVIFPAVPAPLPPSILDNAQALELLRQLLYATPPTVTPPTPNAATPPR